MKQIVDNLSKL